MAVNDRKKIISALLCGMLGCIFMGSGDWLMSESMIFWFGMMLIWVVRHRKESEAEG